MPPYLRLVVPSACWNASKMTWCLSGAMPMPVSSTLNATTLAARSSDGCPDVQPEAAGSMVNVTMPCSVNLIAFEIRFLSTCCTRFWSVMTDAMVCGSRLASKVRPLLPATSRKVRSVYDWTSASDTGTASTSIMPDSIFERSRISLISSSKSEPEA